MLRELGLLLFAVTPNLVLGLSVYRRNPKSVTHVLFALLSVVIAFWSFANYFSVNAETEAATLFWIRIVMAFATLISVFFFLLMHTFPRATFALSRRILLALALVTVVTVSIALSPYLFTSVQGVGSGAKLTPGPGMVIFVPIAILTIPLGLYYLIRNNLRATGQERVQLRYMLWGVAIMFLLILFLVFVNVVLFNNAIFVTYAPLFTLPFVGLTAYAIIRHRLMDIRFAILRTLSFTFLIGAFLLIYGVILVGAVPVVTDWTGIRGDIIAAVAALLSLPLAKYVQEFLERATDRVFFQHRVDYGKAIVHLGEELSGTIDITEVTDLLLAAMREILRSRKTIIMVQEKPRGMFSPRAAEGLESFHITIPNDHPVLNYLRRHGGLILKDDVRLRKEKEKSAIHLKELMVVEEAMNWLDVSVIVPLFVNRMLTGLVLLGDKLSGEPYLSDEVDYLAAIAPQAATALENARLYRQSQEFGERLREEVEHATRELAAANIQLKDIDKAKTEFMNIASHQLYTPLTALRGYLSMLSEGDFGSIPEKQQPVMEILEKSTTRLIELVKSLLDISRIESGRLELNLESVNMVTMVRDIVRDLMPNALAKRLRLTFHNPPQLLPHVVADAQRLRQVVLNIIDNAIKYTESGRIDVTIAQTGTDLVIEVQDTGKGIAGEEIPKLFNKFSRVGGASRFHTEGTGLGLYVAKQIVEEHHGSIRVTSPGTGKGSTFILELPVEGSPRSLKREEKVNVLSSKPS